MLTRGERIHFIGIGGAGMSAIAKVYLAMGYAVSGSDVHTSTLTQKLQAMGAVVYAAHKAENVHGAQSVVISSAIPADNVELLAAKAQGIPVCHRADMIAALMRRRRGIAVAGAHGKTTTTAMISLILEKAGLDPTVIIGGELNDIGGNAKLGRGEYVVAEADESDASFLRLSPYIGVVTNIEDDHMDFYKSMDNIVAAFRQFLLRLASQHGSAVVCYDNPYVRQIAPGLPVPVISYALENPADYTARDICGQGAEIRYNLFYRDNFCHRMMLHVPGRHNVANSLAAAAACHAIGVTWEQIAIGLAAFKGAQRRFQTKGRIHDIWVVDDYAHHPTEIKATLRAARETAPTRLICVFQPHRYTRTKLLQREFADAFASADMLILTDIYSAGEQPIAGVSGELLKQEIERYGKPPVVYIKDKVDIVPYLLTLLKPGDLVMTMGAGDIYTIGERLVTKLQ